MEMIKNPHYLYRMTVLVTISLLAPVVGSEATCQTMLPVVISAAKDRYLVLFMNLYQPCAVMCNAYFGCFITS